MALPLKLDYAPMDALRIKALPEGPGWQYEPKWDGFRCLVFRDGNDVHLQSKSGQPLGRYFPEIIQTMQNLKARAFVLDGEIVIPARGSLSFENLLLRIHPSERRVTKLAGETPATFIAFDLLADERRRPLFEKPLSERREALEAFASRYFKNEPQIVLSPATRDRKAALNWFSQVGNALDGIIAKHLDMPYQSGNREGMVKIKQLKSADCVVGGFRYASGAKVIGSLLLGLYDGAGLLNHVGFTSSFKAAERAALTEKVEALIEPPGFTGNAPGGPSRWSTERTGDWHPLKPVLVVEVEFDHFTGGRFRHGTKLLRWRPDKKPAQCLLKQVEQEEAASLDIFQHA